LTTIEVTVSDELMDYLRTQAAKRGFTSPAELIVDVLEKFAQRESERQKLEKKHLKGPKGRDTSFIAFWDELAKIPKAK
jgi:metal-responsive CopG/Arc/MetJ family transcriptional regulator